MAYLLWIALAGAAGTLARFGVQRAAIALLGSAFPWGTLAVNALGCLLFGYLWGRSQEAGTLAPEIATPLMIGFLGAFTTFSAFAFETVALMRQQAWGAAVVNLVLNNVLGLGLFAVGLLLARGR